MTYTTFPIGYNPNVGKNSCVVKELVWQCNNGFKPSLFNNPSADFTFAATGTTGKMVAEATGLNIVRYLSGSQGGDQQISARIACDEIDLLLFFRDPMTVKSHEPNENDMFRLCDMRNIPVATNIATAEVLIHGLERGDLDWRNIVNPANR